MTKLKKALSIVLVVIMLTGTLGIVSNAADEPDWGYIIPTNSTFSKPAPTVYLSGSYDYIYFYVNSKSNNTYFAFELYSDKNYEKNVAYSVWECDAGEMYLSPYMNIKSLKTGTYYAVTYAAKINSKGKAVISEESICEFKVKVTKSSDITKQMVILGSVVTSSQGPYLKWYRVTGCTKYDIYRKAKGETKWTLVGTTSDSKFVDKKALYTADGYTYTVRGRNDSGARTRYKVTGMSLYYVGAPKITRTKISGNNLTLTWTPIKGADVLYVYRRQTNGAWQLLTTLDGTAKQYVYDISNDNNESYQYTVRAAIYEDGSKIAGKFIAGDAVKTIGAPIISQCFVGENNNIYLKWNKKGNQTYDIYRREESDTSWTLIETDWDYSQDEYYVDSYAKTSGANYIYTVRAKVDGNKSYFVPASPVSYIAMPELVSTEITESGINFTWDTVNGAVSYTVMKKPFGDNTQWTDIATVEPTVTSYLDTEIEENGAYYYTVRANGGTEETPVKGSYNFEGLFADTNPIALNPLEAYQNAVYGVVVNGNAGYVKKSWQDIDSGVTAHIKVIDILLEETVSFDKAQDKVFYEGDEATKTNMPIANCSAESIKEINAVKLGDEYIITLVMNEQVNPLTTDSDGLGVVTKDILFEDNLRKGLGQFEGYEEEVGELDNCEIKYTDYTITVRMKDDGRLITVKECGTAQINVTASKEDTVTVLLNGDIEFNALYTVFGY